MAIFHSHIKTIGRANYISTVRALSIRSGVLLVNEQTGQKYNCRTKNIEYVELILPEKSPQWAVDLKKLIFEDREKGVQAFCNLMEGSEKRKDARIYREIEYALPQELTLEQNIKLSQEFSKNSMASRGIPVLSCFHTGEDKKTGEVKPRVHALMSTRPFEEKGSGLKNKDWDSKVLVINLRKELCDLMNFYLKHYGHESRVDHRSYEEQGIAKTPQKKRLKRSE